MSIGTGDTWSRVAWLRVPHRRAVVRTAPVPVAVVCLTLVIRLILLRAQSGWYDEAWTVRTVHEGWWVLVRTVLDDVHPLLYYLLLRLWLLLIGFGLLQARLFSILCDGATAVVLYSLARRLFDRPTALVTGIFFAVSPAAVWYAATARMYALTELLALLTIRLLLEAYLTQRARFWLAFALCATLAINADYSGMYLVCAGLAWYLLLAASGRAPLRPLLRSMGLMAIFLIPTLVVALRQIFGPGMGLHQFAWIPAPTLAGVRSVLSDLISRQAPTKVPLVKPIGISLAVLAAVVCRQDARRPDRRGPYLLLVCMIGAPLALSLLFSIYHPIFITQQVLTLLFGLLLVFGRAIVLAWRPIGLPACVTLVALNLSSLQRMSNTPLIEDWRHAVPYVLAHSSGPTLVVFDPSFYAVAFSLYADAPSALYRTTLVLGSDSAAFSLHAGTLGAGQRIDAHHDVPPSSRFATIWRIEAYPQVHPFLPRSWTVLGLKLTAQRSFVDLMIYRFTRR